MPSTAGDAEIQAIESVIGALEPLDADARSRVLDYALKRLGIASLPEQPSLEAETGAGTRGEPATQQVPAARDIRSLRDEKQPRSANEMAALVAYYLTELAPADERKTEISTADIQKYFKQAGHPLPQVPAQTLRNAAAAGYFDSLGGGRYQLNPVGHNLVAHNLPRETSSRASGGRKAKTAKRTRPSRSSSGAKQPSKGASGSRRKTKK